MTRSRARRYAAWQMYRVPGWFGLVDAMVFEIVDRVQRASGIEGDLVEIGVHAGRSAILLGHLREPGEEVWACDVFDQVDLEPDHVGSTFYRPVSPEAFLSSWSRHHERPPRLVIGASSALEGAIAPSSVRLLHVDGGHDFEIVARDLAIAEQILDSGGVVAIDDWRTSHSPGVGAATWQAVFHRGLVPLAVTDSKLYGTWSPSPLTGLRRAIEGDRGLVIRWHRIAGADVACVTGAPATTRRALVRLPWSAARRVTGQRR